MQIVSSVNEKENKIKYLMKRGVSANTYKTEAGPVLKRFLNNKVYQQILSIHNNDFLEYLKTISLVDNEALVKPDIVYVKNNHLVTSYLRQYIPGMLMNALYPKTLFDSLIEDISCLYTRVRKLENLHLRDIHEENIVYTGDLKIIDLDMCSFTDKDESSHNIAHLDSSLFRGIFSLDANSKISLTDEHLNEVYLSFINHEIDIVKFLQEYRAFIINEYGSCKYVKSLQKNVFKQ